MKSAAAAQSGALPVFDCEHVRQTHNGEISLLGCGCDWGGFHLCPRRQAECFKRRLLTGDVSVDDRPREVIAQIANLVAARSTRHAELEGVLATTENVPEVGLGSDAEVGSALALFDALLDVGQQFLAARDLLVGDGNGDGRVGGDQS